MAHTSSNIKQPTFAICFLQLMTNHIVLLFITGKVNVVL